ncbi:autotransporter assembly complex protein TamA [Spiribacter pallidus]|uniref:autotransporter assembly complex protein TamA n=1 Tax=Spiribacter pallidus TaxID=1987936 RepID=UPI0034A004C8
MTRSTAARRRWGRWQWLTAGVLVLLIVAPATAGVRLTVEGAPDFLADNIRAHIDTRVGLTSRLAVRFYRDQVRSQVRQALEALGYYEADADIRITPVRGDWALAVRVTPGPRLSWRRVDVALTGPGRDDPAFRQLLEALPIRPDQGVNHRDYERSKRALRNLARQRGYFDYRFTTVRLAVNAAQGWADARITMESGPRYRLGAVRFSDAPLRDEFLQRLVPFKAGAPYHADRIAELSRRLLDSGYFADATVDVLRDKPQGRRIPLAVTLTTRPRNTVTTGIGFSTDEGPRGQLGFTRHYINNRGHRLESGLRLSPVRQRLDARYEIPLGDPLNDHLAVTAGWENEDIEDSRSERYTLGLSRRQSFRSGWVRTQSLRLLEERFRSGEDRGRSRLLMPGISFSRTRSRGGVDPYRGDAQRYAIEASARDLGSDVDIARLRLANNWLRSLGTRHRFQLRADLGAIATNAFARTPTSLRFFAGGDQSVRGFAYRSLGPIGADGEVTGGRYLATGSAEYSYAVASDWRAAVFVDGGNAFDHLDAVDAEVGTGVGVRWQSPVGPLRLDFAWGVSRDQPPFRLHLSLGPPF